MKSLLSLSLVLAFSLAMSSNSQAQISLLSTDLTSVGDQITRYTDTIPTYGPGAAGAGVTWDFSSAINDTTAVTNVVTVASTGFASTFPTANYAMRGVADSYLFFTHDANSMTTTGAAGDLLNTGQQIESPFSDALTLHQFPRTYGSHFADTYAFITEADGAGIPTPIPVNRVRLTHTGHVYDTTDAYGTLITPTGTYDAIRVKSVDFTTDILEYKLFSFSQWAVLSTTVDTSTTYSWHAKEEKLAIAEFAFDSLDNPARFTYSAVLPVTTVGIADAGAVSQLHVYPQPATDQLFIKGLNQNGNHRAELYSIDGKMIRNEVLVQNSLNVNGLKSGMYILRIIMADGTAREPMKFIVQQN
jgi:hypothetical protein